LHKFICEKNKKVGWEARKGWDVATYWCLGTMCSFANLQNFMGQWESIVSWHFSNIITSFSMQFQYNNAWKHEFANAKSKAANSHAFNEKSAYLCKNQLVALHDEPPSTSNAGRVR
jgi:hypothetical protein